jgi:hypothetical protein
MRFGKGFAPYRDFSRHEPSGFFGVAELASKIEAICHYWLFPLCASDLSTEAQTTAAGLKRGSPKKPEFIGLNPFMVASSLSKPLPVKPILSNGLRPAKAILCLVFREVFVLITFMTALGFEGDGHDRKNELR